MAIETAALPEATATVRLVSEEAEVHVRDVTTGRIRVTTHVEHIEQIAHAELQGEAVDISRVEINRPVIGVLPQTRLEGDVTIVPVFEEVLVVEKRLYLKEELHIRRSATTEIVDLPVTLLRQTATVDRIDMPSPHPTDVKGEGL